MQSYKKKREVEALLMKTFTSLMLFAENNPREFGL